MAVSIDTSCYERYTCVHREASGGRKGQRCFFCCKNEIRDASVLQCRLLCAGCRWSVSDCWQQSFLASEADAIRAKRIHLETAADAAAEQQQKDGKTPVEGAQRARKKAKVTTKDLKAIEQMQASADEDAAAALTTADDADDDEVGSSVTPSDMKEHKDTRDLPGLIMPTSLTR